MPAHLIRGILPGVLAAALLAPVSTATAAGLPGYATSRACRECHAEVWQQWSLSPHARMLHSVKEHPDAVAADKFSPDIPFRKKDIAFTIGSHWIQKYLTVIEGQFYVLPKYWSISKGDWEPYSIFNWRNKPYSLNCYGCHTVGFDPVSKTQVEDSIVCEACHGPGAKHAASQAPADIVNPARLSKRLAGVRSRFTTCNDNRAPESIHMTMVDGPFRRLPGDWHFRPLREDACKVHLNLHYDFAPGLLGRAIAPVFETIAGSLVDSFTRRAGGLYECR